MKILASDFDGTFYVDSAFDPADLEAVKAFQKAGNLFGFCTGRPLNGITPFFDQWDFRPDFYIVNTGSVVLDKEMHYLLQNRIDTGLVKDLVREYKDEHFFIHSKDNYFTTLPKRPGDKDSMITHIEDVRALDGEWINSFSFFFDTEQSARAHKQEVEEKTGLSVYITNTILDCIPKGCSKATGLDVLVRHLGVSAADVYTIGDSFNDLPMIVYNENGATFHRSPQEVQAQAGAVVGSVAEWIHRILEADS